MSTAPRLVHARAMPASGELSVYDDPDITTAIAERDEALIADEVLHGAMTGRFVYDFEIAGNPVSGVSVIGARHLMYHYGGLRHRLVASTMKRGAQFIFTTYPSDFGARMSVAVETIHMMEEDPDFYQVLCELTDTRKSNSLQRERTEMRYERRRDGSQYERPNYQTIAQSKAYRNAVLDLLPQDVVLAFKAEARKMGKSENITENIIEAKRRGVMQYAASKGVAIDRAGVQQLGWEQIAGLSEAARGQKLEDFVRSAHAVGIVSGRALDTTEPAPLAHQTVENKQTGGGTRQTRQKGGRQEEPPPHPGEGGGQAVGTSSNQQNPNTPPAGQQPTQETQPPPAETPPTGTPGPSEHPGGAAPDRRKDLF